MKTVFKPYDPEIDYLRIRNFLVETFSLYQRPFNWTLDRWNFCRYFVLPIHTFYNMQYFGVPTQPGRSHRDEVRVWEESIGVWENRQGEIVGVAHNENEEPGEAWLQIHPEYTCLYDEMITFVEGRLADRSEGLGYVKLYINDNSQLEGIAEARGYRKLPNRLTFLEYNIQDGTPPELPDGFFIKSVAEEDDIEKRRFARALAFGANYAPSQWPPASVFRELQSAPDYRKELDLFITAPGGDYASFTTIWVDQTNRYGVFEPVGTHVEYQRLGLGRALLREGFQRMADCGAERSFMASNNEFYLRVGFRETNYSYSPWIKYFEIL